MPYADENEDTLDQDFLLFTSLANTCFLQLTDERHKALCIEWLSKLCSECVEGISQKRNRNIFLLHLLMNMQEKVLTGPFLNYPQNGPLPPANQIFGSDETDDGSGVGIDETLESLSEDDEGCVDGRTYVAIRSLPNNRGSYAFVALNTDKETRSATDIVIVPCMTDKDALRHVQALHKLSKSVIFDDNSGGTESKDSYIRNIEATVSGDITRLYENLHTLKRRCGRDINEIEFYDMLIKEVDDEIKGVSSKDKELVMFLISRLKEDLKKIPRMKHLFEMTPEQQKLKLLEILRQKLVIRQQEKKRVNILAEMEGRMFDSSKSPLTCMNYTQEQSEAMWQLIVTQPLSDAIISRLYDIYPEEAISTFVDLLIEDRQTLLDTVKKKQNALLESMRSEVYKEIQAGKAEYNKYRTEYREWNEILSTIEEMMYEAGNEVVQDNGIPDERMNALIGLIMNMKEMEALVVREAHRGEILTEKIIDANTLSFTIHDNVLKDISWEIKSSVESMRNEIRSYKILIEEQKGKIKRLRRQYA